MFITTTIMSSGVISIIPINSIIVRFGVEVLYGGIDDVNDSLPLVVRDMILRWEIRHFDGQPSQHDDVMPTGGGYECGISVSVTNVVCWFLHVHGRFRIGFQGSGVQGLGKRDSRYTSTFPMIATMAMKISRPMAQIIVFIVLFFLVWVLVG
jgi:hypothetical protein